MSHFAEVATRAELLASGLSRRGLAKALRSGTLVRARRDRYVRAGAPKQVRDAVRIGGRVACLSLLQILGIFVLESSSLHVHVERGMSRLRSTADPAIPLERRGLRPQRLHWMPLVRSEEGSAGRVGLVDSLAQSILCQPARHAIATLDSALNKGLILAEDLVDVFAALPLRYGVLRSLLDGRAQSGPETLVRLMARALGCRVELQVHFDGVGYVDLVLDRWLVVECDSKEFHENWGQQAKDRERDLALAARGYVTLRFTAAQIMYRPDEVLAALRGVVETHRGCQAER